MTCPRPRTGQDLKAAASSKIQEEDWLDDKDEGTRRVVGSAVVAVTAVVDTKAEP